MAPYALHIGIKENRLVLDIRSEHGKPVIAHLLSLTPFKRHRQRLLHDLRQLLRRPSAPPRRIKSKRSTWAGRACTTRARASCRRPSSARSKVDFDTARRLFTLICVLHWKG
jgi:uncharacterized protein (UPF0262 family)